MSNPKDVQPPKTSILQSVVFPGELHEYLQDRKGREYRTFSGLVVSILERARADEERARALLAEESNLG